jgi:CBS domain-containing protein
MVAQPVWGHTDQSVDAFVTDTATRHPHTSYPVVDNDGRPVGLVHLADLARVPPADRPTVPLRAAVAPTPTVAADEPASAAARSLSPATPLVPVTDHERLVGVVATNDIAHVLELAELGRPRTS